MKSEKKSIIPQCKDSILWYCVRYIYRIDRKSHHKWLIIYFCIYMYIFTLEICIWAM